MKNFRELYVEYKGLKGGWWDPFIALFNGTIGKSVSIINKTLFPNFTINTSILSPDRKLDPIFQRDDCKETRSLLPPPSVYYSLDQAIYQDTNGKKVLGISMDNWNDSNTTTNIFYFIHNSDGYITILNATKLEKVGFVKQTLSDGYYSLKDQYFGVLYAVAKIVNETTQKEEDVFTLIQFFVNVDDSGIVQNITMGYALPITEDAYSNQVTRTSFTATNTNWVGTDFQKSVDESFTNPFFVDVIYSPSVSLCALQCSV